MDAKRHLPARIYRIIKSPKAVNFLTFSAENGKKMTEIWGIDNLKKLFYPESDERIPQINKTKIGGIRMDTIINREQADALCTVITLGFIIKSKEKPPYNSYIIYHEGEEKDEETEARHLLLREKLMKLAGQDALFEFNTQYAADKSKQPIIMAQTRKGVLQGDFSASERKIFNKLEENINQFDTGKLKGAYVGGLLAIGSSELLGPSILDWYESRHRKLSPQQKAEIDTSYHNASCVSEDVQAFLDNTLGERPVKDNGTTVRQAKEGLMRASVKEKPDEDPNKSYLFASVHGMTQSIIRYHQTVDNNMVNIELALSKGTCKVASCIPCSIFMWSNGTPASATHFGRGDNWNFPITDLKKMREDPTGVLPVYVARWIEHVREAYDTGKAYFPTGSDSWISDDLCCALKFDSKEVPQLFLEALTFEGSFLDKMLNTLENMPM